MKSLGRSISAASPPRQPRTPPKFGADLEASKRGRRGQRVKRGIRNLTRHKTVVKYCRSLRRAPPTSRSKVRGAQAASSY
eukprot:7068218-Pyramimonas_sp.AAC.1